MPFYKKANGELQVAPNFVHAPSYSLDASKQASYTYPVDGWYWYNDLDEAMAALSGAEGSVSMRQAEEAMLDWILPNGATLLDAVDQLMAQASRKDQIAWKRSYRVEPDNATLLKVAPLLGLSDTDLVQLFNNARTK